MLKDVGVYSIENFWYILKDTWLHQIQLQYQSTNYHAKVNYTRHITTANNQDLENISISTPLEQAPFIHGSKISFPWTDFRVFIILRLLGEGFLLTKTFM